MFAEVLIITKQKSPYDNILTYHIPVEAGIISAGNMVRVTIRGKEVNGLVLEVHEKKPNIIEIKPILEKITDSPVISEKSLEMAKWLAGYYLCSLNKTLALFMNHVNTPRLRQIILLNKNTMQESMVLSQLEQDILIYIKKSKKNFCSYYGAIRKFGAEAKDAIKALINDGIIELKNDQGRFEDDKDIYYKISSKAPEGSELEKKAPKQAELIEMIKRGQGNRDEIIRTNVRNRAVLKKLEEKKWIIRCQNKFINKPYVEKENHNRSIEHNMEQIHAIDKIKGSLNSGKKKRWLLFGVTGSGKTEVYIESIKETIATGKQVLYLVPEIALAQMTTRSLIKTFGRLAALLNSSMSEKEKRNEWNRIEKREAQIVIGPRSALFAPFSELGLIIIDEEHENTFKQNEPEPRYDARTAAEKLAEIHDAVVIRGSATPSLNSFYQVENGNYEILVLPKRVASRKQPKIKIIDMKKQQKMSGSRYLFSDYLVGAMTATLDSGEQIILFLNRRGYNTILICNDCGKTVHCPNCSITMTYHKSNERMICHSCNHQTNVPAKCPACGSKYIKYNGAGTERVAWEFEKMFPEIPYTRVDTDTTRKPGSHIDLLKDFESGRSRVLIGTQMIAKGLDFPGVTLVGVLNMDTLLNMPDYSSAEKTYQLLTQVSGRAGRGEKSGEVVIQTYDPNHYVYGLIKELDYYSFIKQEMQNRKLLGYPPYRSLARLLVTAEEEKKAWMIIEKYKQEIIKEIRHRDDIEILGPSKAPVFYIKGRCRYHMVLKGENIAELQDILNKIKNKITVREATIRLIYDIEPVNMM